MFALVNFVVGIVALVYSSKYLLSSLAGITKRLKLPIVVVGVLLLALSTSLAELTVGIHAALNGTPALSLGDVLGTNIVNLTLILGVIIVINRGVKIAKNQLPKQLKLTSLLAVATLLIVMLDGALSRTDGVILLSIFVIHVVSTYNIDRINQHIKHKLHNRTKRQIPVQLFAVFIASAIVLIVSGFAVVNSAVSIAQFFGVSEFVIGLLVLAIGTSLPEMAVAIRASHQKTPILSIENLIGAVTINVTLVIGIVATISPFSIYNDSAWSLSVALVILAMIYIWHMRYKRLSFLFGLGLIVIYAGFLLAQVATSL